MCNATHGNDLIFTVAGTVAFSKRARDKLASDHEAHQQERVYTQAIRLQAT